MSRDVRIGTSGFGLAQATYLQTFRCVEVQHTFYQPPALATVERWRANAPPTFEFVLKAWQLITHDARSPTYRRLKKSLSEDEAHQAGSFKPTAIVKEAGEVTFQCARALNAQTILFQCPASFRQTQENISNLKKFFDGLPRQVNRRKVNFCWEPRGEWDDKVLKGICDSRDLWHVVDPFVAESVTPDKCYFRLHGRNGWRYEYAEAELRELAALLSKRRSKRKAYVFFNNVTMTQDALRFLDIMKDLT